MFKDIFIIQKHVSNHVTSVFLKFKIIIKFDFYPRRTNDQKSISTKIRTMSLKLVSHFWSYKYTTKSFNVENATEFQIPFSKEDTLN